MQLYDVEDRLVAVEGDASAVWQTEAKQWKVLGRPMAVKAQFEGEALTADEAKRLFPEADMDSLPELGGGEEPATDQTTVDTLDKIEALIDGEKD